MKAFSEPMQELGGFEDLVADTARRPGLRSFTGCIDAQKPQLIYAFGSGRNKLVVTYSEQRAKELTEMLSFYDPDTVFYPAKDVLFYQADVRGNVMTTERLTAMKAWNTQKTVTMVTTFDALMNTIQPPRKLWSSLLELSSDDTVDLNRLQEQLAGMGYEKEFQVQARGQYALRGGILDIFPLTEEMPVRIEFWGDVIDTIRLFDVESQKSVSDLDSVTIYPACELVLTPEERREGIRRMKDEAEKVYQKLWKNKQTETAFRILSHSRELAESWEELQETAGLDAYLSYFCPIRCGLLDYFSASDTLVFLDEPSRCFEHGRATETEFTESMKQRLESGLILPGQMRELFTEKEITAKLNPFSCISVALLDGRSCGLNQLGEYNLTVRSVSSYNRSFDLLVKDLQEYRKKGYRVILMSGSRTSARNLTEQLRDEEMVCHYTEDYDEVLQAGVITVCYGKVHHGYEYPDIRFAVITETDIFGEEQKKKKKRRVYEGEAIASFQDLSIGDYVVHEQHGIGIYRGIEQMETDHILKDYIHIEYGNNTDLYILPTQLDRIQKYAGKEAAAAGKAPKLHSLGSSEWGRTRAKVRGAVKEIAQDLVNLYARRQNARGYVYGPDTVWQREFEELFPFEETEDQILAIEATKQDMESTKVMDRLICGDVGYGKTEIAIRAAFKAVQENKQVAYLAPTTILAQQVYNTFSQRMKDFPVRVDLMCRFRTAAEQKKTLADLKKGQVDIVVGTHRILSKDVEFKDLGLLVVDEEQRFGVAHKERIKQMKTNVDVLTLTATPIPRTLHMSLIGIRDMSVLEEPPMDRLPIQTYVMEYNEEMVREAITRELARDGQVYYVYNKVASIGDITARIQELVPDAVVAYAHGKMKEKELENIMYRFINREIDVLVSTTIIETGLDISNVNTMIIHDADNMGLSQLYQLRGRVGRSNRTAFAFLMYRRNKVLREVAEKRLAAIREYSDLGSGFKIAMRDLEIRGAGNLLGAEQSGHMEAVGYDLYCKMLNEAVKEAKGESVETEMYNTTIDLDKDAYIPDSYIPNETMKLDLYKRIAGITTEAEYDEMIAELIDRFGDPPRIVCNLLGIALLKAMGHRLYMTDIRQKGNEVTMMMYEKAKIMPEHLPELIGQYQPSLIFSVNSGRPFFRYTLKINSEKKQEEVLEVLQKLFSSMEILLPKKKA